MSAGILGGVKDTLFGDPNDEYRGVGPAPSVDAEKYTPGQQTAKTYQAQQIGDNALAGATGDTGGQAAQRMALANLQRTAEGGLNATDKAALFQSINEQQEANRGAQGAIAQGAAGRGVFNSGATLAAQLSAQQANQESGARAGADVAGQAAERAIAANGAAGQLGGQLNQQALALEGLKGNAENAIRAANMAAANRASEFNAGAENNAQQFNIGNDIAAKQFLAALMQQQYANQFGLASAKAGNDVSAQNLEGNLLGGFARGAGGATAQAGMSKGGEVPGAARVPGDSYANDTVDAKLSPGEIVLPRSVVNSPSKMVAFLEEHTGLSFANAVKKPRSAGKVKK